MGGTLVDIDRLVHITVPHKAPWQSIPSADGNLSEDLVTVVTDTVACNTHEHATQIRSNRNHLFFVL